MRTLDRLLDAPLGRPARPGSDSALGILERWYAAQDTPRVVVAALELDAPVTREALARAAAEVHRHHHEVLDRSLEPGGDHWDLAPKEPLLRFATEARPLASAIERAIHEPFASRADAPRYRVDVSDDGRTIVASFDHVIADGMAAVIYAHDLAHAIAGNEAAFTPATSPATPLELRLDLRPRARDVLAELRSQLAPKPSFERGPDRPFDRAALRTRVHPLDLAPQCLSELRSRARANGVTVHAALGAASILAARAALPARALPMRFATPISVRARCAPEPTGMGVFISTAETDVPTGLRTFWGVARHSARDLARKRDAAHRTLGLLSWAPDLGKVVRDLERRAPNLRNGTVEVSNLGVARLLPRGTRVSLTQGNHYAGPVFCLTVLTSHEGTLRGWLSVPHPLVDDATAQAFCAGFTAAIAAA